MTQDTLVSTEELLDTFLAGFNNHDPDAVMATMSDDVVFESSSPGPNGRRVEGAAAVREAWVKLFQARSDVEFKPEDTIMGGDQVVTTWNQCWTENGQPMNVRGLDILRIRDGKIVEKRTYVKK